MSRISRQHSRIGGCNISSPQSVAIVADSREAQRETLLHNLESMSWTAVGIDSPAPAVHAAHKYAVGGCVVFARFEFDNAALQRLAQRLAAFPCGSCYLICVVDHHDPRAMSQAYEAGAKDVLARPFTGTELQARLDHAGEYLELATMREQIDANGALMAEMATATAVHSRNYLLNELSRELERSRRYGHPLSVILAETAMDCGPAEGALRASGHYLLDLLRKDIDWLARYGQSSFAMVLPETNVNAAHGAANRLARKISGALAADGVPAATTWNFGVTAFDRRNWPEVPDAGMLLTCAEKYLTAAKSGGEPVASGLTSRQNTHHP